MPVNGSAGNDLPFVFYITRQDLYDFNEEGKIGLIHQRRLSFSHPIENQMNALSNFVRKNHNQQQIPHPDW